MFGVALPLAVSSPYPTAGQGQWILPATSAPHIAIAAQPAPAPVAEATPAAETSIEKSGAPTRSLAALTPPPKPAPVRTRTVIARNEFAARWKATGIPVSDQAADEQPTGTVRFALAAESTPIVAPLKPRPAPVDVPAEAARITPPERKVEVVQVKKPPANPMDVVDEYLWQVYLRAPVKKDGSGDFTWKDPAAAKRMHISLKDYVIRGMDPDFREQMYHMGHAMDAAGLRWSMMSAFRDDYRQALASGFKARPGNSLHGGSRAVGGYGHGRAIDINNTEGGDDQVWRWIDAHGARYGIRRPRPGYDPAHIQAGGDYPRIAAALRESRTHTAAAAPARKPETQASVRSRRPRAAM